MVDNKKIKITKVKYQKVKQKSPEGKAIDAIP
jgi:hypothetical protein